jgi:DNA repair protein RadD
MTLRPYQADLKHAIRSRFAQGAKRVLAVAPTGAGKTVIFADITRDAVKRGTRTCIVAHRAEILDQISVALTRAGVQHGRICAGWPIAPRDLVQVASIQTLAKRLDRYDAPDFVVVDEAHHVAAGQYRDVIARYDQAHVLGVTATPERLDGRGLGEVFDDLVQGPSVQWLIDNGFLARPVYWCPTAPDLSGVRTSGGDYNQQQLGEVMDKPAIVGDAVRHYQRIVGTGRAVVFSVNITHAQHTAAAFAAAGIASSVIDGTMERFQRRQIVEDFSSGKIRVLCSCNLISEGFDLPTVDAAIALRPTKSLALWLQQVGRALRPSPGKTEAHIIDHVGNTLRLGCAEDAREWTLDGRKKRKRAAQIEASVCEHCFAMFRGRECPQCATVRQPTKREVEQREGELQRLEARDRKREEGQARTLAELQAVAEKRGYSAGWAWHRWKARRGR